MEREGELWRVRGDKPERWVQQTDFANAEAVGYLADRLNRIGIEDRLLELGAQPGDGVAIGGANAVVLTSPRRWRSARRFSAGAAHRG